MPQLREVALMSGQAGDTPSVVTVEFDGIPEVVLADGYAYVLATSGAIPTYRMATLAQPRAKTREELVAEGLSRLALVRARARAVSDEEASTVLELKDLGVDPDVKAVAKAVDPDATPALGTRVNAESPVATNSPVSVGGLRVG